MENNDLREKISACLNQYREKMLEYNKKILDQEILGQQIDKESDDPEYVEAILEELWGDGDDMKAVQKVSRKVSDIYEHLPDGTKPAEDQEWQGNIFSNLELSLNQVVSESRRPIAIPQEIKVLATLTGGIIGPGFPMLQETTIVSAFEPVFGNAKGPEKLGLKTGLLPEDGWELLVGFQCGYSGHGGSSHVVYGKCTGDPSYRKFEELGWMYVITYAFDQSNIYGNLFEYIEGYTKGYSKIWEN